MAERGGQKGNKNASSGRQAKQALEVALSHGGEEAPVSTKMKTLVEIWNAQIKKAKDGDHQAASMIVDRLDGKAAQSVDLNIGGDVTFNLDYKN
jgi:hypothetical protein